jgi:hypothetical protein
MTIYRMYAENGDRAGFWVQHRDWRNTCALVLTVGGQSIGRLPGKPPNYGEAEVVARQYDVRSGRVLGPGSPVAGPGDKNFSLIAIPSWSRPVNGSTTMAPAGDPAVTAMRTPVDAL